MDNAQTEEKLIDWAEHFSGNIQAADYAYIRDTWLDAFYKSPWAGCVPNNLYREVYTQAIDQLIARGSKLLVIRNPANPALLISWICYELTPKQEVVIHFAFTKPTYRKNGAAAALIAAVLSAAGTSRYFYTFRTPSARYFREGTYRPEIARRRDTRTAQNAD